MSMSSRQLHLIDGIVKSQIIKEIIPFCELLLKKCSETNKAACHPNSDLLHRLHRSNSVSTTQCGRGGIGRRAALRSLWGNPWKFESSR
ncbi:hypothetical protein, partial [Pseudochrobactrum asaccharolyticum]|uniref:hypothetical protein n=1 Tax=Pseudochrobactrum asaccharolyticum TaxID=354351 RepID=UPI001AEC8C6B